MSVERLAEKAILPRQVIDDIEAGLETFLAPAIRQKLARALLVRISVLKEVEIQPDLEAIAPTMAYGETAEDLLEAMVEEPDRTYFCPLCGEKLQLRMFDRRDIQNNPMIALKINCSRCLFRLEKN